VSFPRPAIFLLVLFAALALSSRPSESATAFSTGYLVNQAGYYSATTFTVSPSPVGEPVLVKLYFSNESLAKYFSLSSTAPGWNGAGFPSLAAPASFDLTVDGLTDESLMFQNHTIWVEVNGVNKTLSFFPIPGIFYERGRSPPSNRAVGNGARQAALDRGGAPVPVEVTVDVW
jgi:hypothetical protein